MEPSELLKLLGELSKLLTAGGEHIYAATYQSVMVSVWRDIYIFSGLTLLCALLTMLGTYLWKHWKDDFYDGLGVCMTIFGFVGWVSFALVLCFRVFDLQRLDYLTIEALKALVK